jgi:hypothetical protein
VSVLYACEVTRFKHYVVSWHSFGCHQGIAGQLVVLCEQEHAGAAAESGIYKSSHHLRAKAFKIFVGFPFWEPLVRGEQGFSPEMVCRAPRIALGDRRSRIAKFN